MVGSLSLINRKKHESNFLAIWVGYSDLKYLMEGYTPEVMIKQLKSGNYNHRELLIN